MRARLLLFRKANAPADSRRRARGPRLNLNFQTILSFYHLLPDNSVSRFTTVQGHFLLPPSSPPLHLVFLSARTFIRAFHLSGSTRTRGRILFRFYKLSAGSRRFYSGRVHRCMCRDRTRQSEKEKKAKLARSCFNGISRTS